ncbi:MAG: hypothetical protein WC747_00020 [Candidatus Babeliales bacterium]
MGNLDGINTRICPWLIRANSWVCHNNFEFESELILVFAFGAYELTPEYDLKTDLIIVFILSVEDHTSLAMKHIPTLLRPRARHVDICAENL